MYKLNKLSSFVLKIIAIITMTCDHIGFLLLMLVGNSIGVEILRAVGRLALPIFCFLLVEGVRNTHSFNKYCLRLGIMATLILGVQIALEYGFKFTLNQGNIFLDLLLGALMIKCLLSKKKVINCLVILPLIVGGVALAFYCFDYAGYEFAKYFPYFLRPQYHIYSLALILGFFFSYKIAYYGFTIQGIDPESVRDTPLERVFVNSICVGFIILITTLFYVVGLILDVNNLHEFLFWNYSQQNYAMISGAFLLFYSGKLGYNRKWFKYGCYIYYPLHILLLYLIFSLIL